jgi:tetratricopeptide (TPR) repeat protein
MWVLTDLGIASLLAGDHDMSRRYMEAGLAIALEQGWTRDAAIYYGNLGAIADEEGDLDLAAELFEGTLAPLREAQDRQMEANMTANLASVELRRGRLSYASELLSRSLTLGTIDDTLDVTDALITAAAILSETGDARTAAVLVAHTSATVEQTKLKLDVNTARLHTETTDQAREALGPDAFDDAWAAGCALTSEGAVALALEALADE